MTAVFKLEVNSFRKLVKDSACLTSEGKLFQINFIVISSGQENGKLIFRISKVVRTKYIARVV